MAFDVRELTVRINGDVKDLKKALDETSNNTHSFGKAMDKAFKVTATAALAVGGALTAIGISSVKSFEDSQDIIAQTNAVLKSTGGVAGVTADQVDKLATSLQKVSKYSDEDVRSAENMLLTFTSIGKDVFPDATKVVLDMSTALGQDLKSSSIQLGKALQDPINGVTALRRVGVNFSEAQQKVIDKLVETGKTSEAQKMILKELQKEFGGSAEAAGKTFTGQLAILNNQLDDVKEAIGQVIINALTPLASKLSEFVASDKFQNWVKEVTAWMQTNLPKAINYISTIIWPILKKAFEDTWPVIQVLWNVLKGLLEWISKNTWVLGVLAGAFIAVKTAMVIDSAVKAFSAGMAIVRGEAILTSATLRGTITTLGVMRGALAFLVANPWVIAVGIVGTAAVLADLYTIKKAVDGVSKSWDEMKAKKVPVNIDGHQSSVGGQSSLGLIEQFKHSFGFRASGGPVTSGSPYIVGEEGPELVIPNKSGQVINARDTKQLLGNQNSSSNITLNVNVGMYAGMPVEKRQIALTLWKELVRAARAQGVQLPNIGAVSLQ